MCVFMYCREIEKMKDIEEGRGGVVVVQEASKATPEVLSIASGPCLFHKHSPQLSVWER